MHNDAWAVAVYDTSGGLCGSGNYCIWGVDVDSDAFRCSYSATSKNEVSIIGGIADDRIWFHYSTFDLMDHTSSAFVGRVSGKDGDDQISGSRRNDTDYSDVLNGDDGIDTICGRAGDDEINGGAHDDLLLGEDGNDTILGSLGEDQICGNLGNDALFGGPGNDWVWSEADGTETVQGNAGTDACSSDGDGSCEDWTSIGDECDITL